MADRASLEQAKLEAAIGNRALTEFGLAAGIRLSLGHVSMRVPGDPELFVVKGRGYRVDALPRMRPEDMVVCDLDGNWVDGPPYSTQCSEVKIHSCIYKARPDVMSVTHVHPDYVVLMTVMGAQLAPMAQEGANIVTKPLPMLRMTKIVSTQEEGQQVADLLGDGMAVLLLGHGAVTTSTRSVEQCVMNMAQLEHQARLNYLAIAATSMEHPSIPLELATAVNTGGTPPHIQSRVDAMGSDRRFAGDGGVWAYLRETLGKDM